MDITIRQTRVFNGPHDRNELLNLAFDNPTVEGNMIVVVGKIGPGVGTVSSHAYIQHFPEDLVEGADVFCGFGTNNFYPAFDWSGFISVGPAQPMLGDHYMDFSLSGGGWHSTVEVQAVAYEVAVEGGTILPYPLYGGQTVSGQTTATMDDWIALVTGYDKPRLGMVFGVTDGLVDCPPILGLPDIEEASQPLPNIRMQMGEIDTPSYEGRELYFDGGGTGFIAWAICVVPDSRYQTVQRVESVLESSSFAPPSKPSNNNLLLLSLRHKGQTPRIEGWRTLERISDDPDPMSCTVFWRQAGPSEPDSYPITGFIPGANGIESHYVFREVSGFSGKVRLATDLGLDGYYIGQGGQSEDYVNHFGRAVTPESAPELPDDDGFYFSVISLEREALFGYTLPDPTMQLNRYLLEAGDGWDFFPDGPTGLLQMTFGLIEWGGNFSANYIGIGAIFVNVDPVTGPVDESDISWGKVGDPMLPFVQETLEQVAGFVEENANDSVKLVQIGIDPQETWKGDYDRDVEYVEGDLVLVSDLDIYTAIDASIDCYPPDNPDFWQYLSHKVELGLQASADGLNSVAVGKSAEAYGERSTAVGQQSQAVAGGDGSAFGSNARAASWGASALGAGAVAEGFESTAIGMIAQSAGYRSVALGADSLVPPDGYEATAVGFDAESKYEGAAFGAETKATGIQSTAVGARSIATGDKSLSVGARSDAGGESSVAIGYEIYAPNAGEINLSNVLKGRINPSTQTPTGLILPTGFVDLPDSAATTNPDPNQHRLISRSTGIYARDSAGVEVGPLGENTPLSADTPEDLGTAAAGVGIEASRSDHVHPMPSAADVGALPAELIGLTPEQTDRGAWDENETYTLGDVVFSDGFWVGVSPVVGSRPGDVSGEWDMLLPSTHIGVGTDIGGIGDYSTAVGVFSQASGDYSTTLGLGNQASGDYSTAVGVFSQASGDSSTALGYGAEASGDCSTALGFYAIASDEGDVNLAKIITGHIDTNTYLADALTLPTGFADLPHTAATTNPDSGASRLVSRNDGLAVRDDTGIESKLVIDTDARLTDARTPLAHTHGQSDVTGLGDALGELRSYRRSFLLGGM